MSAISAPMCRLCGHEHWSIEGHTFKAEKKAALAVVVASKPKPSKRKEKAKRRKAQKRRKA